jgi:hypothetical protein
MPSGGNTPLDEDGDDWKVVERDYREAVKNGMQFEYLRWMLGGVIHDKLDIKVASYAACIEWDF